jgi:hypothetical protein
LTQSPHTLQPCMTILLSILLEVVSSQFQSNCFASVSVLD